MKFSEEKSVLNRKVRKRNPQLLIATDLVYRKKMIEQMKPSGYSGTPLAKKLGIRSGFKISIINEPKDYFALFSDLPDGINRIIDRKTKKDFIHYFAKSASDLNRDFKQLKQEIEQNGMIWISWPKKAAKVETDLDGNIIREIGLNNGLVDIKVCAVNEIWSGLKFVIPVKERN